MPSITPDLIDRRAPALRGAGAAALPAGAPARVDQLGLSFPAGRTGSGRRHARAVRLAVSRATSTAARRLSGARFDPARRVAGRYRGRTLRSGTARGGARRQNPGRRGRRRQPEHRDGSARTRATAGVPAPARHGPRPVGRSTAAQSRSAAPSARRRARQRLHVQPLGDAAKLRTAAASAEHDQRRRRSPPRRREQRVRRPHPRIGTA